MLKSDLDPIVAVATAMGKGGIGIVRLSFRKELDDVVLHELFGRSLAPRYATLVNYRNKEGELLDQVLALFFPAPHSYTGESVLEIQAHGGGVLLQLIVRDCLERLQAFNIRLAEPGEFTQRAFLNGRIDLMQAEAVADVIDAVSGAATMAAARSLSGEFSTHIHRLGVGLDELRAYIEATLDFPEEEVENLQHGQITRRLSALQKELQEILQKANRGQILRDGLCVAIVGSPNVGKSSLLNALAEDDVAIVTDIPGTTRDKIETWITISGVPIKIVDTAGIRETDNTVEKKGIERALKEVAKANIVLHIQDASGVIPNDEGTLQQILSQVRPEVPLLTIWNKADLAEGINKTDSAIVLSAKTGQGLDKLRDKLLSLAGLESTSEGLYMARDRHLQCLKEAAVHIQEALDDLAAEGMLELVAEELRLAGRNLGEILGETVPDDLLGIIFSKFCIGK